MIMAVPDIDPDEQLLTVDQACGAAYQFIRQFYERDSRKPESMFPAFMDAAGAPAQVVRPSTVE
jgi:hypothetical protein